MILTFLVNLRKIVINYYCGCSVGGEGLNVSLLSDEIVIGFVFLPM